MIVGNSREPYMCVKKDERAFMNFWHKHIFLPPPDYASRTVRVRGGARGGEGRW